MKTKIYLGDGLYARDDGFQIWLTAEDGISIQNEVALEPAVLQSFIEFVARSRKLKITVEHQDQETGEL